MARFISTAIPYVNSRPHLGHALEYVQADVYVRGLGIKDKNVFFLTGTDDNALKNVQAAEAAGKEIKEFIAENAQHFIDLDASLGVEYSDFIRTSVDERHRAGAQKLWLATKKDDLYKKSYKGFYCTGCEEFKTQKELINGECPEHPGRPLEEVEEENYFFRLSAYQNQLEKLIESDEIRVIPDSRKHEALSFIRGGLEDFSVSRSARRAKGWGIQVPNDPDQYMYVWYDALANYITALGYFNEGRDYQDYWVNAEERTHMIGKGINRFHTIYWPAMLLSAGVPLPTTVFIHGYITSRGQKMSKSIGNVIDPNEVIKKYGLDATRYLLLRHVHPTEDSDVTWERLDEWYTANLVNGIGNLVARVMQMAATHLPEPVLLTKETQSDVSVIEYLNNFEFTRALDSIWERIGHGDALITLEKPFSGIKSEDENVRSHAVAIIQKLVRELNAIAAELQPFMPNTSAEILAAVKENKKPENLFPRLP